MIQNAKGCTVKSPTLVPSPLVPQPRGKQLMSVPIWRQHMHIRVIMSPLIQMVLFYTPCTVP
jgi:hypothetical protein